MEPGTHWCALQDGDLSSVREDTNGGALHLRVAFNAKKGGSLDIARLPYVCACFIAMSATWSISCFLSPYTFVQTKT